MLKKTREKYLNELGRNYSPSLCSFDRVGSFLQDLADGLDAVLPLSLAADPHSECCLNLLEIRSDITGLWQPSSLLCLLHEMASG